MKKLSFKPFLIWFGYTRRERRASFLLLVLILIVAGFRHIIPHESTDVEEIPVKTDTLLFSETNPVNDSSGSGFSGNRINYQSGLLEINTCDSAELVSLPGIGPVLSVRIIKFRSLLGGFARVEQLKEVYGLPEEVFHLIAPRLMVDTALVTKIMVNSAEYRDLIRLPYFESYEVSAILKYRELEGRINDISDMTGNKLISPETAQKVRPYLDFGE